MSNTSSTMGSVWRKWDLHIHTPASFHWKGGQTFKEMSEPDKVSECKKLYDAIENNDICAYAIMDYWTFDGYLLLKKYINDNSLVLSKTVFPGMELRIEAPTNYRLNIHVILSDQLTPQQLTDFKSKLHIGILGRPISDESIIEFAKKHDASKAKIHGYDDPATLDDKKLLELGSKTVEISRESFASALKTIPEGKALVVMPYDTSDGLKKLDWKNQPSADNFFMQLPDIFESRDEESINLFLDIVTESNKNFIANFQKTLGNRQKPVISGSDAHRYSDYGNYPSRKATWIKADPTFNGLKQIMYEPRSRVYIGELPPKMKKVANYPNYFIKKLEISSISNENEWFDNVQPIELNSNLISIIGNKGSGKSALADIIGATGNAHTDNFEFLKTAKFLNTKSHAKYSSRLLFADETELKKSFSTPSHKPDLPSRVIYFSQAFVNELCEKEDVSRLKSEIERVIYAHIPEEERMATRNLDEILLKKTKFIDIELSKLREKLNEINVDIVQKEILQNPIYLQKFKNGLDEKKKLFVNLEAQMPEVVPPPILESDISKEIQALKAEIISLSNALTEKQKTKATDLTSKYELEEIKNSILQKDSEFREFLSEICNNLTLLKCGINPSELFEVKVTTVPIETAIKIFIKKNEITIKEILDIENKINEKNKIVLEKEKTIDSEHKIYLSYIETKRQLENRLKEIDGSAEIKDSIKYYEKLIEYITNFLPSALTAKYEERCQIAKSIVMALQRKMNLYPSIYSYAMKYSLSLANEFLIDINDFLQFSAGLRFSSQFETEFFSFIDRGRSGTFYTLDKANNQIKLIESRIDLTDANSISTVPDEIIKALKKDISKQPHTVSDFEAQILNKNRQGLYDYLFGFSYIETQFNITFMNKPISLLSPGEKGNLLLIFYLLIDNDNRPIIIDQPEENLDNETVAQKLVPFIKKVKEKRQVIIVTHNPNLAVYCDSEQIILANIDKRNSNIVTYKSGSIENFEMREKVMNVLEGTKLAFDYRKNKYFS
ncbi:MAG: AAA family ATPase [Ignavibacteriales bacterium]|nr:AAA family ATPase [Ignavibacteriales bacterium]